MEVKQKTIPLYLDQLSALVGRTLEKHPKRQLVDENLYKYKAGFKGEMSLQFYLRKLPQEKYFIFHDIRLPSGNSYFQMDIILLSRRLLLFLEVKNISGTLFFEDKFNQMIRINEDGKEERFQNPLIQVYNQKEQLLSWFRKNNLPIPPIESQIVISNPHTILKTSSEYVRAPLIIHSEELLIESII